MHESIKNILFVGTGGRGCNLAGELSDQGVDAVGIDTMPITADLRAEDSLNLNRDPTSGSMQTGELYAEEDAAKIKSFLTKKLDDKSVAVICAQAGGGFGGGSVLVLVEIIKQIMQERGFSSVDDRVGVCLVMPPTLNELSKKNAGFLATVLSEHFAAKSLLNPFIVLQHDVRVDWTATNLITLLELHPKIFSVNLVKFPTEDVSIPEPKLKRLPPQEIPKPSPSQPSGRRNIYGE